MTTSNEEIYSIAAEVIKKEAQAVTNLLQYIDNSFIEIVKIIYSSKGRLIVSGVGKSAIIAQKIVATLNSTGSHSLFMHAADAIHGDIGIIMPQDIVMLISKSGNTPEIKMVIPLIKRMGNLLIGMVSNSNSFLASHSNHIIKTTIESEACPNNLAPTSSTTTQLVMGDALAVALLKMRGFSSEDFAKLHPGGSLGKRLYLRAADLIGPESRAFVREEATIQEAIFNISSHRLGATVVLNGQEQVIGIITDGDIRRMVERGESFESLKARDIMSLNPKKIEISQLAYKAFGIMEKNKITSVVVLDGEKYKGLIHIHDIIREGVV